MADQNIQCGFCKHGDNFEDCGKLRFTKLDNRDVVAHQKCMQYSACLIQYKHDFFGGFDVEKVAEELKRGKQLRCNSCKKTGATAGCAVRSCRRSYHFPCANLSRKIDYLDPIRFRVFCSEEHERTYMMSLEIGGSSQTEEMSFDTDSDDSEANSNSSESSLTVEESSDSDYSGEEKYGAKNKVSRGLFNGKLPRKTKAVYTARKGRGRPRREPPISVKVGASKNSRLEKRTTVLSSLDAVVASGSGSQNNTGRKTAEIRRNERDNINQPQEFKASKLRTGLKLPVKKRIFEGEGTGYSSFRQNHLNITEQHKADAANQPQDSLNKVYEDTTYLAQEESTPLERKRKPKEDIYGDKRPRVEVNSDTKPTNKIASYFMTQKTSSQNIDGTDMESANRNKKFEQKQETNLTEYEDRLEEDTDKDMVTDSNKVFLLIPSVLQVPYEEVAAIHRDLGIQFKQSVVWPPFDKRSLLEDKYMPHFMLDVVENLRLGKMEKLRSILTTMNTDNYEYLLRYFSDRKGGMDEINKETFHRIAEKLSTASKNVADLKSRKFHNMKVLVVYLSPSHTGQRGIISSLRSSLFKCDIETSLQDMFTKQKRNDEELEQLWRWFMSEIKSNFEIRTFPNKSCAENRILFDETFSSEVTNELVNNMVDLLQSFSVKSSSSVAVIAIDGASRKVLKYKAFVKQAIMTFTEESHCGEIFFIISIEETDGIHEVQDIIPSNFGRCSKIYTAFSPDEVCISCIVIHINKTDPIKQEKVKNENVRVPLLLGSPKKSPKLVSKRNQEDTQQFVSETSELTCSVVKTDVVEKMYFNPVDADWQKEKAAALGLKMSYELPLAASGHVSVLEPPTDQVPIREDGNCYFRAVSHILTGSQRWYKIIRQNVYEFLSKNDEEFSKLTDCSSYADSSSMNEDGVWATEVEIFALASMLATDVCVYSPCGLDAASNTVYKWLTYKPMAKVLPIAEFRKSRKTIYLSNMADHYIPVYRILT